MTDVTITFHLREEVTPDLFAQKIILACARGGAIRPGEAISVGQASWTFDRLKNTDMGGMLKSKIEVPVILPGRKS